MMRGILIGAVALWAVVGTAQAQEATFGSATALTAESMGATRAADGNVSNQTATVEDNVVTYGGNTNFSNSISGSFSSFSGIASVVQNNGSAAAIQVDTNLTLNVVQQ